MQGQMFFHWSGSKTLSSAEAAQNLQFSSVLIILVVFLLQDCHSITFSYKIPIWFKKMYWTNVEM